MMTEQLAALFLRDWRLAQRLGGGASLGVMFFLILVTMIPFAVGPDQLILARIGAAVLWIAALLAGLLGLDRLFQLDQDDGSLDLLRLCDLPLEIMILTKCAAHWCATGLPLVVSAPIFGLMLGLEPQQIFAVTLSLFVGTPALTALGAIGAAVTLGVRRGGLLMAVLILPFTIPILIFGVSTSTALADGMMAVHIPLTILCGLSLLSFVVAPFAAAAAVRHMGE
jgi:heme exporter protein B